MASASVVLIIVALVLFALAALSAPSGRFNLVAGGLFCWCLSGVIGSGPALWHLH